MAINKNLAEGFMTKRTAEPKMVQDVVNGTEASADNTTPKEKLSTEISDVRRVKGGYLFNMGIKEKGINLKDVFFPLSSIYTTENLKIRAELRRKRDFRKKMLAYFLLYPAAIISLVVIMSVIGRLWNYLNTIFDLSWINLF